MPRDDWKKLPRLYVTDPLLPDGAVSLTDAQQHYLQHVMRRAADDRILLFNGTDGEWLASLVAKGKKNISARCLERTRAQAEESELWLLFAPLKRDHLDYLVQKASELGVTHLMPVATQHTVAERVNLVRLRAIAMEAAEQCERLSLPEILAPLPLPKALENIKTQRLFACVEGGTALPVAEAFSQYRQDRQAAFLVGPEGGFSKEEMEIIRKHAKSVPIHLGPRILRADTAALAALACWQAVCGDWR
ncbi:MAG: 16S rRNA (uracil(1498)-N(3))-methyltransferase [Alphaproteobacteria bacterium]